MGFFPPFSSKKKQSNATSWVVILKGAPDKRTEEALIKIFTERLEVPGDDALKVIRSAPIILFGDRTAREAEQIKLIFNKTGARTAISNDPNEFKKFPRVSWPKEITIEELAGGLEEPGVPPPSEPSSAFKAPPRPAAPASPLTPTTSPPIAMPPKKTPSVSFQPPAPLPPVTPPPVPQPPVAPRPAPQPPLFQPTPSPRPSLIPSFPSSPPVSDEWKNKYEGLQQSYRDVVDLLEKKETDIKTLQNQAKVLEQQLEDVQNLRNRVNSLEREKVEAVTAYQESVKALEELRREFSLIRDTQETLQKEMNILRSELHQSRSENSRLRSEGEVLRSEKEKLVIETERFGADLAGRLKSLQQYIDALKGLGSAAAAPKTEAGPAAAFIPAPPREKNLEKTKAAPAVELPATQTPKAAPPKSGSSPIGIIPPRGKK